MTLDQIQTLCRIVECGSLQLAAESLHKTQPALSMSIKKLENEYGFAILNRDNYRLTLTPEGKHFYGKAQELLLSAQQLNSLGNHLGIGNESTVPLSYCPTSHMPVILEVLKNCQQQFPNTSIQLLGESRFGALEQLSKGKVDMAITPWWPVLNSVGDLISYPISHFKVILVATPELFKDIEITSINELKREVHIGVEESDLTFDTEIMSFLKGCRQWLTRDVYTLKDMLMAGLGWGFIPELMAKEELENGSLIPLQPNDIEYEISGEIRLVRRSEKTLGPVASMIWDEFIKNAKINS